MVTAIVPILRGQVAERVSQGKDSVFCVREVRDSVLSAQNSQRAAYECGSLSSELSALDSCSSLLVQQQCMRGFTSNL